MGMGGWGRGLEGLGQSLLALSAQRTQDEEREKARQYQNAVLALQQQQADRADMRERLEMLGPNAQLAADDPFVARMQRGGYGAMLEPQQQTTLPSTQFVPGAEGTVIPVPSPAVASGDVTGFRVRPTAAQQIALDNATREKTEFDWKKDDRGRIEAMRNAVNDPSFLQQPREKRQMLWTSAQYPGQVPETWEEQRQVVDYQHKLELEEIAARTQGDLAVSSVRARSAGGNDSPLDMAKFYYGTQNAIADNVRAQYAPNMQVAVANKDYDAIAEINRQIDVEIAKRTGQVPRPQGVPAPAAPRLADPVDDAIAKLDERQLQAVIAAEDNPEVITRIFADAGINVPPAAMMRRLKSLGFFNQPAPQRQVAPSMAVTVPPGLYKP